jgi:hypothetical protein
MSTDNTKPDEGASSYGAHFFKDWDSCEKYWWFHHRAPHPERGTGLVPFFVEQPLVVGTLTHRGLDAWLRSGATDGKYSLDAAIEAVRQEVQQFQGKMKSPELAEESLRDTEHLLEDYHSNWGPGGVNCDYPLIQVVSDTQGPIIEREYSIDLGGGRAFTCRVDAVIWVQDKWYYVYEHKTTSPSYLERLLTTMRLDSQSVGQSLVLRKDPYFSDKRIQGVMLNVLVKKGKTRKHARDPITHTDGIVHQLEHDIKDKLEKQDRKMQRYQQGLDRGLSTWDAARVFNLTGTSNGSCFAYNRLCAYYDLCSAPGREEDLVSTGTFKPYRLPEEPVPTEER